MAGISLDGVPAELTPTASKNVTTGSYINFQDPAFDAWTQQHLPDLYAGEVERYGNRSVSSFLRLVGAEIELESDQAIWTEQGRLHLSYTGAAVAVDAGGENVVTPAEGSHAVRVGQMIKFTDATGIELNGIVTEGIETNTTTFKVACYQSATGLRDAGLAATGVNMFVYGSEFAKGTAGMVGSITPEVHTFANKPIIIKDDYEVSGSDMAQIGWVEISGEAGQSGYLWYLKAEGDTRTRFEDYLEMSVVESVSAVNGNLGVDGTEGFFEAIENRGIVASDVFDAASDFISDFDVIIKELDKQGSIEENMMFLNRDAATAVDNGLATVNSYGTGGTSYGVFENSEDMALNLGFSGFRRGSYDFYKTDWKYLNDAATRGGFATIQGVLVPAGTTTVYDKNMGKNIRRPFLHVRYRGANRKMKSWVTGSAGGAATSTVDEMRIDFLSERCLCTLAANNFVKFNA